MALSIKINCDTQDEPQETSGVTWITFDEDNDKVIFSAGSTTVADGEAIPSDSAYNQAGTIITTSDVNVAKYFLEDSSAAIIREIHNAGNQNKRYVFCFSFSAATASEPLLEVWDDSTVDTTASYCLGESTPADSWFRGVLTTDALPGASWTGTTLAGDTAGYFLYLNDEGGALSVATDLYINLKIVVPANFGYSGAETPVLCVKYCQN